MKTKPNKHCTLEEIDLAEIGVRVAEDHLREAQRALKLARHEHKIASGVLEMNLSRSETVEELHDEGFDYETAEAIVEKEMELPYNDETKGLVGDIIDAMCHAFTTLAWSPASPDDISIVFWEHDRMLRFERLWDEAEFRRTSGLYR